MTDRIPLDHLTSDQYDALCDELAAFRAVARGYCPHCGRGDAAPTVEDWEQQRQRAEQLAGVLGEVLARFTEHGHPGEPCVRTPWLRPATVDRWRTALDEPAPAATQATEPDGDPDTRCGDPYRTEHHGVARCSRGLGHPGIHAGHADDGTTCQWPEHETADTLQEQP